MPPLRFAVIGVGVWGRRHASTLRAIERDTGLVHLAAIADTDQQRLHALAHDLSVAAYPDFHEMLDRESIDAACVCTPDQHHVAPALACLARRLHVLVEKPLATTANDALRLATAAREAGVVATVGHILRHVPQYRAAHEAVTSGRLGDLIHLIARRFSLITSGERIGGRASLAMFQAIHDLDVVRWLGGPVTRVHAEAASRHLARYGAADSLVATLRFASGAVGMVECSWALPLGSPSPLEQELDVLGTAGRLHLRLNDEGLEMTGGGGHETPLLSLLGETPQALRDELLAFVDAIQRGGTPTVSMDDGIEAVRLAEAADRSLADGKPVVSD